MWSSILLAESGRGALANTASLRLGPGAWTNWARNQICRPVAMVRCSTEEAVVDAVHRALRTGVSVKAVGTGHSFTDIACSTGVMLELSGLAGVLEHSTEPPRARLAAGTRIEAAAEALWALGLSFSSLGDIGKQTVAGAVATGTHGTSFRIGSLSSQVVGVRFVDGTGEVREVSAEKDPDLLDAMRVNLGALGIVTSIVFQLEPAYALHTKEWPMPLQAALEELIDHVAAHRHFEFFWFPHTDVALAKAHDLTDRRPSQPDPKKVWFYTVFLGNYVFDALCRIGRAAPRSIPAINRFIVSNERPSERTLPSHKAFINERRVRFYEMEYAVPAAEAPALLQRLRQAIDRTGLYVSFPIEVRYGPPESAWLSPAHGRDTVWIAVHTYRGSQPTQYFQMFEDMARRVGGRPHWGKMHYLSSAELAPLYPRWSDFLRLRDELDPKRVFANPYLDRVLGP